MDPRVVALSGPLKGQEFRLAEGAVSVGRDPSNRMPIRDVTISRQHCIIEIQNGGAVVTDLESHNGTFVNGIPVSKRALAHGDVLRMGQCELVYLTEDTSPSMMPRVFYSDTSSADIRKTVKLQDTLAFIPTPAVVGRIARDLDALVKISRTINSIRDPKELQHQLLERIFEVVPAETGAILLIDRPEDEPTSVCAYDRAGRESPEVSVRRELVQRALWEQSAVIADTSADSPEAENAVCVPLLGVQRTVGVIYLTSTGPSGKFEDDHGHFLNSAASIAAVALENVLALESLKAENRRLRAELEPGNGLVGDSKSIRKLSDFVVKVAQGDSVVLIRGESGTGKELIARAIHAASARADKPFVAINCAAIPETLLESELFGHEKGSFTGAVAMKKGKLEVAEDGTILLDEIGELAPTMQAKLLRVLQQREFDRVGGTRPLKLRARVLAATNKDLEAALKKGEFRQDLFFRLNVVSISVPPLRKRREDIPLLAIYFATQYAQKCKRPFKGITPEARALLLNYEWPGNIRELENAIEHAIVMGASDEIRPEDLPENLLEIHSAKPAGSSYHVAISELKKRLIRDAVAAASGSYTEAAKALGVHPNYLHRLIRNLDMKSELRDQESE
ncbi:MAG TPA: sigma 54-interacting transcriptional regulator [Terriglobales bacterium]